MSLLLLVLASTVSLVAAAVFFVIGQHRRAGRILIRWVIGLTAYATVLVTVAAARHPSDLAFKTGTPFCDDDLCGSIEHVDRIASTSGEVTYRLGLRLFSKAIHGRRSAQGATLYLTDEHHRRFFPVHDASSIPLDVAVAPGQSVNTSLTFIVPSDAQTLFFAAQMDRVSPVSFMIGNGDLLHKPRISLHIR
jgi:hypothetical protein